VRGARKGLVPCVLLAVVAITACSGLLAPSGVPAGSFGTSRLIHEPQKPRLGGGKIDHVVVLIQENRSFDNFFDCFPGTDCVKTAPGPGPSPGPRNSANPCPDPLSTPAPGPTATPIQITFGANLAGYDIGHSYCPAFVTQYDRGKMDGFYWVAFGGGAHAHLYPYRVVARSQIQPYWDMATQYVLADRMFPTQASGSFTAHQDLIRGSTKIAPDASVVDYPWNSAGIENWGCDDRPDSVTSLLTFKKAYLYNQGPFPCFGPTKYQTLRDLLDEKNLTWKYYVPAFGQDDGQLWNAFDAVYAVRHDTNEWAHGKTNPSGVSMPETNFFTDLGAGKLARVTWVIPDGENSDHGYGSQIGADDGPDWVASVVNAIGRSRYWKSTAIFILWDDWGGFYDSVPPPQLDYEGLGYRVPMIVVSPYAKKGYVSHVQYEFGSVLKFIERTFALGSLDTTDRRANDITDPFNFSQQPRPFATIEPINKRHTRDFFLREPPSNQPVDTQ
jgi:phospholipase C